MARELSLNDQKAFKKILVERCRQAFSDALIRCTDIVDSWKVNPPKNPEDAFFDLSSFIDKEDWRINDFYYYEYDYEKIVKIVTKNLLHEQEMVGVSDKGKLRVLKDADLLKKQMLRIQERAASRTALLEA